MRSVVYIFLLLMCCPLVQSKAQTVSRLESVSGLLDSLATGSMSGLAAKVRMDVSDTPLSEFIGLIASANKLNISVAPNVSITVSHRFTDVTVKDVLLFFCTTYQLDIELVRSILLVRPYVRPLSVEPVYEEKKLAIEYDSALDRLTINLKNDSLALLAKQLTQVTGKNVLVAGSARDVRVTGFIKAMPLLSGIEMLASTNNLVLKKNNDHFLFDKYDDPAGRVKKMESPTGKPATSAKSSLEVQVSDKKAGGYISVYSRQIPLVELIHEIAHRLNLNFYIFSLPDQLVTVQFSEMTFEQILDKILTPTDHTYKLVDGVYLIGARAMEGLRTSSVYKMQFRSIEDIDKIVPPEIKKDVQLTVFKELNAVILSGSTPQISEICAFLKALDEPVPNILIEVIVVDFRNGYTIETGINAILSDNTVVPQTTGKVFPGVDLTLGTNLITELFQRANIVNLGEITPRLYVTLKALENSNNITIRSTPKLSTLNGHDAVLSIGQSVYYVQETQVITPGVTPLTRVTKEFKEVEANLTISIKPIVSGNEHVTLNINAEFSNFLPAEIEGAPPGNATRQFNSMIRIRNGEMIVLGGLEEVSRSSTQSGVPLLARIPIIKWLFSSRKKEKTQNRLVVFIKPVVVF